MNDFSFDLGRATGVHSPNALPPMTPPRKGEKPLEVREARECRRCGRPLSRYNGGEECHSHDVSEEIPDGSLRSLMEQV